MRSHQPTIQKPAGVILLLGLSAAQALLALFQWMELVLVRSGGTPVCNINQILSCETVWNSTLATVVHRWIGVPIAGLGLIWGIVAFSMSLLLAQRLLSEGITATPIVGLRLVGSVGAFICLVLAIWSVISASICMTCIGTYVLVLAFTFVAFRFLTRPTIRTAIRPALAWTIGVSGLSYLILLVPGLKTPHAQMDSISRVTAGSETDNAQILKVYIDSLRQPEKQALADSLEFYKHAPPVAASGAQPRYRYGPADAPVQIVDFTDILCPHCRHLEEALKNIQRRAPQGAMSIESRQFPLDSECNKVITQSDGTGIRCLAAKVQICLEGSPEYWDVRSKLFEEQESLTTERVWDIAASAKVARPALEACVGSPETTSKLTDDILYAMRYHPIGTPLVLVNGRQAAPFDGFLFAMVMSKGNLNDPSFASLPAPNLATQ